MRCTRGIVAALVMTLPLAMPAGAQGLPQQWKSLSVSWERALDEGDGQKVMRDAEALLKTTEAHTNRSNYSDMHAVAAVFSMAARGAVLEGDWEAALSFLEQAASTAEANRATADSMLAGLRGQHEAKISEWEGQLEPAKEHLQWLRAQPGLTSQQIKQFSEAEAFIGEHSAAIAYSKKAIQDIEDTTAILKANEEACIKSREEWEEFCNKESREIQGLGSVEKYVAEKLAQVVADTGRTWSELVSYTRRLNRLDPSNEACRAHLRELLAKKN